MGRKAGLLHRQLSSRIPIKFVEKERKSSRYATAIAAPRPVWLHACELRRKRCPAAKVAFFCVLALGKDGRSFQGLSEWPNSVSRTVFFTWRNEKPISESCACARVGHGEIGARARATVSMRARARATEMATVG